MFHVCPVGNQQFEVLLAEGNLIDGLYAVATVSRPSVGSLRSVLEAAFNALAASGIQCVLDFWASHDSQCCIVFHTASRCCFPLHSAGHGCLVARIGHRVRGHRCSSHFARISCFFFTVHSWEEDARGKSHSCPFTDPCVSPILVDLRFFSKRVPVLRNRIKRACVLVERINGKVNLNRVFRLRWLCEGRACRVFERFPVIVCS